MKSILLFLHRREMVAMTASLTALALVHLVARGEFKAPEDEPIDRLTKNVAAYIAEHPAEARGYYILARLHSLAFIHKSTQVRVYKDREGKGLPDADHQFHPGAGRETKDGQKPSAEALGQHLDAALKNFQKAISMEPKNGLYRLGYGYILEAAAAEVQGPPAGAEAGEKATVDAKKVEELVKRLGDDDPAKRDVAQKELRGLGAGATPALVKHVKDSDPEVQRRVVRLLGDLWREQALAEYLKAHELAIEQDLKIQHQPLRGLNSLVGYEAGQRYVRLIKELGIRQDKGEDKQAAKVEKALMDLDAKPIGKITPIVFPLDKARSLDELLAPEKTVRFDLDGTRRDQAWPWVKPNTGILVWDPRGSGAIESGRQLFGSVTWWMFWEDGYHALDALDDNRDGVLTGGELPGLAVWRDADGNGISDPGEVSSVQSLGVESLAVRATDKAGASPANLQGIRFADGRVLPTYDWIAEPRRPSPRTP